MTPQEREELRLIQRELRQPLKPSAHKIRPLPGSSDLYVYLPWQEVRDRLEEVAPDYQLDFDDPVYDHTANLISIKATIEILGIKKSAIAGVKIAIISQKGNNAEIGHCIDRLHAEAIKNAGEAWCVGRYLDDQLSVYKMLWDNQAELDSETRGKLNQMKVQFSKQMQQYHIPQKSTNSATRSQESGVSKKAGIAKPQPKSDSQYQLYPQHETLIGKVRELTGHTAEQVHQWCKDYGYRSPGDLSPELARQLADDLALGWGESKFASPELAATSYKGKISIMTASGVPLAEAIANWIESVELMPVLTGGGK